MKWMAVEPPPERKSLGQYVYDNLKRAVIRGDIAAGSRIVESRLALAWGISRTPIREAIHKLEREGLLRHNPSVGFFVVGLTQEDIDETFGIRSVLESYAAKLAAIQHRPEELEPLEKKIEEYQVHMDQGQLESLPRINTEFHDLLYALSRSPRLIMMINDLRDLIYRFREVILKMEHMARASNQDHRQMLASIRGRDADGVERLVKEHIRRGQDVVKRHFGEGGVFDNHPFPGAE
jgi:DNA-binding GntR family transcriptional regulator